MYRQFHVNRYTPFTYHFQTCHSCTRVKYTLTPRHLFHPTYVPRHIYGHTTDTYVSWTKTFRLHVSLCQHHEQTRIQSLLFPYVRVSEFINTRQTLIQDRRRLIDTHSQCLETSVNPCIHECHRMELWSMRVLF